MEVEQNGPSPVTQPEAGFCATPVRLHCPASCFSPVVPGQPLEVLYLLSLTMTAPISTRPLLQGLLLLGWLPYFLLRMKLHCFSGLMGRGGGTKERLLGKAALAQWRHSPGRDLDQMFCS